MRNCVEPTVEHGVGFGVIDVPAVLGFERGTDIRDVDERIAVLVLPVVKELDDIRSLLALDGRGGSRRDIIGVDLFDLDVDFVLFTPLLPLTQNLYVRRRGKVLPK
jgi:hypothetical protein